MGLHTLRRRRIQSKRSVLYKPDRFKGVHSTTPYCFDVYFLWLHRILTVFQTQRRHEGKNTAFFIVTPPAPKVKTGGMQMKPQKIKYAPLFAAMLLCVALAGCDGALHESGEGRFSQSETQDGTRAAPRADAVRAAAGGDIALPPRWRRRRRTARSIRCWTRACSPARSRR